MIHLLGHQRPLRELERLRESKRLPHAILFTGPYGIGKSIAARHFISSLLCTGEKAPCGGCHSCRMFSASTHPDFIETIQSDNGVIPIGEPDNPSPGSIRHLIWRITRSSAGNRVCALIDGIDKANQYGQNAILKTLEEPTPGTIIVLTSSNRSNVIPTIFSRVREIRFSPLPQKDIVSIISNKSESGDIADFAAAASNGSPAVALFLLEKDFREKILSLCRSLSFTVSHKAPLEISPQSLAVSPDLPDPVDSMISIYRSLLAAQISGNANYSSLLDDIYIDDPEALRIIIKTLLAAKSSRLHNANAAWKIRALTYGMNDPEFETF